jgi:hypothetical protein
MARFLVLAVSLCLALVSSAALAGPWTIFSDGSIARETWWRTQTGLSPNIEAQMTNYVGDAAMTGAGRTGGDVGLKSASNWAYKAASGIVDTAERVATRVLTKASWLPTVVRVVKWAGPTGIALTVAGVAWDVALQTWKTAPAVNTGNCSTTSCGPLGTVVSCKYNGVQGYTYMHSNPSSSCPTHAKPAGSIGLNNCTNLSNQCGYFPQISFVGGALPSRAATDQEIQQAVSDAVGSDSSKAQTVVDAAANSGTPAQQAATQNEMLNNSGSPQVSGPASSPVHSYTTTINNGGATTVQTTSNQFTYNYAGDTVNVTNNTTVTTTAPDGTTTTQSRVEAPAGGATSSTTPNQPEEADFCARHPSASACLPFPEQGTQEQQADFCVTNPTVPACKDFCQTHPTLPVCQEFGSDAGVELSQQTITPTFTSERSAAGSCPPDLQTGFMGTALTISWGPVCTFASGVRPAVLIGATLGAMLFVFVGIRRGAV